MNKPIFVMAKMLWGATFEVSYNPQRSYYSISVGCPLCDLRVMRFFSYDARLSILNEGLTIPNHTPKAASEISEEFCEFSGCAFPA